jgi:hypothetical protein
MKTCAASLILMLVSITSQATPVHFKNCKSDIIKEVFFTCPDGESGSQTVCGSKQTVLGSLVAEMTVDSQSRTATASVIYTPVSGKARQSATTCVLGSDQWMECTTKKSISQLGKLSIAFNINGIAPEVYFADIFADTENVPVGGFQNTSTDCEKL